MKLRRNYDTMLATKIYPIQQGLEVVL